MMRKVVLGIDFGSDSVRCLAVNPQTGEVLSEASAYYPRWKDGLYCCPAENKYRQHPLDYIESLEKCVNEAVCVANCANDVVAMSFDTTASTPVLVDETGTPLSLLPEYSENPDAMFVLWKDHTAIEEADRINNVAHSWKTDYTEFCGGSYSCEWVWAKMLHVLKHSPELKRTAYSWVEHCDWIAALLSGKTNPATIARSRCVAGHKAMWNEKWGGLPDWEFLNAVDPELNVFKGHLYRDTVTADVKTGELSEEWAARLGLGAGVAIGVGAIDCHVGAVGAGITPGTLVKVMGTSTCDIVVGDCLRYKDNAVSGICGQVDGSVLPGLIGFEAGQAAFGDVYAWFRNVLLWMEGLVSGEKSVKGSIISSLTKEAALIPVTENDIVATDWFNGRRTPNPDQRLSASISGLTLSTTAPQVFKALVEATAFGSRAITEKFINEGVAISDIVAVGGIPKKSPYVMQVMSDIIGMPIKVLDSEQACALGAAIFASVIGEVHNDIRTAQKAMSPGYCTVYTPDCKRHSIFDKLYKKYLALG